MRATAMRFSGAAMAAVLTLTTVSTPARADGPAEQPASPAGSTPTGPAGAAPTAGPTSAAPPPGASMVRVHVRTPKDSEVAYLYQRTEGDRYRRVCTTPCTTDLPAGAQLRVVRGEYDDEPHDFVLENKYGQEVDIEVKRGGRGALAGGIVMASIGGLTTVIGLLVLAISGIPNISNAASVRTAGLICIGIGVGVGAGGIALISGRTQEASVRQREHEKGKAGAVSPLPFAPEAAAGPAGLGLTVAF